MGLDMDPGNHNEILFMEDYSAGVCRLEASAGEDTDILTAVPIYHKAVAAAS